MRITSLFAAAIIAQVSFALKIDSELSIEALAARKGCMKRATKLAKKYCPADEEAADICKSEIISICEEDDPCIRRQAFINLRDTCNEVIDCVDIVEGTAQTFLDEGNRVCSLNCEDLKEHECGEK